MSALCPSCGCIQPEGLLCYDDTAAVETLLAAIPQLIDQLDIAIAKMAKLSTGKAGKGSAHEQSPVNWGVAAVRDALIVEAAFIGQDLAWLRRHPQAGEMVSNLGRAVKNAYRAIDRARDRKYLGQCSHRTDNGATCREEVWVKPGAHQVTCRACKHTHNVTERRDQMLEDAEDLILTPREASQLVGEVGDMPIGHQRIRNYLDRGRISRRPSPDGVLRFRLGDLLAVLRDDAARHDARAS